MFKKFKQIKDKALQVKETVFEEVAKASQNSNAISEIIQKTAAGLINKVREEGASLLTDDKRFIEAVDTAYDTFPFQVKFVLRRKRFHKIMVKLADKYRKDKLDLTDHTIKEIIENEINSEN